MSLFTSGKRDFSKLAVQFENWLRTSDLAFSDATVVSLRPANETAGQANETYALTLASAKDHAALRHIILRTSPVQSKAIFRSCSIEKQYRVMTALERNGGVPVPHCFHYEASTDLLGAPFYLMDRIEGDIPGDSPPYTVEGFVALADAAQRKRMWNQLVQRIAEIGRVDWRGAGLGFLDWPRSGRSRIEQQLEQWFAYRDWALEGTSDDHPYIGRVTSWLRAKMPRDEPACLLWGDARFGNVIFSGFEPVALLDWEVAQIGNPVDDLAYLMTSNFIFHSDGGREAWCMTQLSGFPSQTETLAAFQTASGQPLEHFSYYCAFNAFKMLSYQQRISRLLLRAGVIDQAIADGMRRMAALDYWMFQAMGETG